MIFSNFRKETSERSDSINWAKALLIEQSGYHLESLEGCNQNANNLVTHLIERARVDYSSKGELTQEGMVTQITHLEGVDTLQRKINFAQCFGLPLSYVLYCDENEMVYLINFTSLTEVETTITFNNYGEFANWIAEIKGWKSNKFFREIQDLPHFDKRLREEGTPWPTNIDCFICDNSNIPIGILEFQNADTIGVVNHCNNDYFLCKQTFTNQHGYTNYHDDIRRWTSQEILRVQSRLRLFVITWATVGNDFTLKEVSKITIPYFQNLANGQRDWTYHNQYKETLHRFSNFQPRNPALAQAIAISYKTFNLSYIPPVMTEIVNNPPLNTANKTFPYIYYSYKQTVSGNRSQLVELFTRLFT